MPWLMLTAFAGPCLLAVAMTMWVRAWAIQRGFVDKPGGHKQHDTPIALGGGIAIFIAIAAPVLTGCVAAWLLAAHPPDWLPTVIAQHIEGIASKLPIALAIIGGALVLHVTGLIDDHRPLGPSVKFAVQIAVAVVIAWPSGIRAGGLPPAPLPVALPVPLQQGVGVVAAGPGQFRSVARPAAEGQGVLEVGCCSVQVADSAGIHTSHRG